MQRIITADENYRNLDAYFLGKKGAKVFLVCDPSIKFLKLDAYFASLEERIGVPVVRFSDFQPNPLYESVVSGVELFHASGSSDIVAVGGGSAMDVAKCIKLYSNMDPAVNYLKQTIVPNAIPFLAVPTTAGTGSEATRYAVIYFGGEKQSVADYSAIPETVLFDPSVLKTLPEYQKKATMMDALCHATESFWSVNSNEESQGYSREAITGILAAMDSYLKNEEEGNAAMLKAANLAGKAINITQTTAGHAMCYKLTSLYGIAHGHAAALCIAQLFPFMVENKDARCIDPRGIETLDKAFAGIATAYGVATPEEAVAKFQAILASLAFRSVKAEEGDYQVLKTSVNPVRLKNNPVGLDVETIEALYRRIV